MSHKYNYLTNIKDNKRYLESFNRLTEKTYGFNFQDWYALGYWTDKYCPHVLINGEEIISNISVNTMEFMINGQVKKFIQLGTVMTDSVWQKQGLSRQLMEEVLIEWKDKTDGIYLFANDSALDYYPKFGFVKAKEYQYSKSIEIFLKDDYRVLDSIEKSKKMTSMHYSMELESNRDKFMSAIDKSVANSKFFMLKNPELIMFYTTSFMSECVFYIDENDTFVIAQMEEESLIIHEIFSPQKVDIDEVISAIYTSISKDENKDKSDALINKVVLGFTPFDNSGYKKEVLCEEGTTLFIMGDILEEIVKQEIMFPTLSHA